MRVCRASDLETGIKAAEAAQEWDDLSKPYQLKIFGMRIPLAILCSDVEAACRMMTVGSKELAPL